MSNRQVRINGIVRQHPCPKDLLVKPIAASVHGHAQVVVVIEDRPAASPVERDAGRIGRAA